MDCGECQQNRACLPVIVTSCRRAMLTVPGAEYAWRTLIDAAFQSNDWPVTDHAVAAPAVRRAPDSVPTAGPVSKATPTSSIKSLYTTRLELGMVENDGELPTAAVAEPPDRLPLLRRASQHVALPHTPSNRSTDVVLEVEAAAGCG